MSLKSASTDILMQLANVIGQLTDQDYARPLPVLSGNTIGKHVRHILEFYELLVDSAQTAQRGIALLNYDRRQRDLRLEVDTDEALRRIGTLDRAIHHLDLNHPLHLEADLSAAGVPGAETIQIPSTFARELLYNIEHAIHHMALIQVAVRSDFTTLVLPAHFGVAYSTVQHQSH
ncbi:DinB family protein [Fibrisoma montanum]|uniref:DinB family protein n=1 Tax=Fibrisoma montanum TaxID=2305895 RepID=A0A418MCE3_9BACT|nr:DinB family protein [Fibrisoma montanum]RIV24000.1 DinB family protein [Fibrisoma montanum]